MMSQKEKIINRYDKCLSLVKDLIKICDVCHIYDNSGNRPFRILKKRKEQIFYDECSSWYFEDIQALTNITDMKKEKLN